MNQFNEIFREEPVQWGLRGDPLMWTELKMSFDGINDNLDVNEFNKLLDEKFNQIILTGKKTAEQTVWFDKFPQFGMSGGSISMDWWNGTGLPLLKSRYAEKKLP